VADEPHIRVRAIDQDEIDAAERENFTRALQTPPKGDTRSGPMWPRIAAVCLVVLAWAVSGLQLKPAGWAVFLGLPLVVFGSILLYRFLRSRTRPVEKRAKEFALSIDDKIEVRVGDEVVRSFDLARVRSFRGGPRISVELDDGRIEPLPMRLETGDHDELAAEADEKLREAKAARAGYR
jgi:hypothetical protein